MRNGVGSRQAVFAGERGCRSSRFREAARPGAVVRRSGFPNVRIWPQARESCHCEQGRAGTLPARPVLKPLCRADYIASEEPAAGASAGAAEASAGAAAASAAASVGTAAAVSAGASGAAASVSTAAGSAAFSWHAARANEAEAMTRNNAFFFMCVSQWCPVSMIGRARAGTLDSGVCPTNSGVRIPAGPSRPGLRLATACGPGFSEGPERSIDPGSATQPGRNFPTASRGRTPTGSAGDLRRIHCVVCACLSGGLVGLPDKPDWIGTS